MPSGRWCPAHRRSTPATASTSTSPLPTSAARSFGSSSRTAFRRRSATGRRSTSSTSLPRTETTSRTTERRGWRSRRVARRRFRSLSSRSPGPTPPGCRAWRAPAGGATSSTRTATMPNDRSATAALDEASLRKLQTTKPNAVENALSALVSLPGYETIREDIERVLARNGQVDMIQALTGEMETYLAEHPVRRDRDDVAKRHGVAYVAYHRIKIESVEKWFSELVCSAASLGEAKIEQIVRELVKRWVNDAYTNVRADAQLLLDLDFAYRMRKIAFLLRRANKEAPHLVTELKALYDSVYRLQRKARTDIGGGAGQLFSAVDSQLRKVADISDPQTRAVTLEGLYVSLQRQPATAAASEPTLEMLDHYIGTEMRTGMKTIAHGLKDLLERPGAEKLRADAAAFEEDDMVLFPLMAEGGTGEPVRDDAGRIRPLDVKAGGGVKKLAGTRLGHFGAFLEADWRMNDILWGRLDGAEMIIRPILSPQDQAVIPPAVAKAHEAIIDDLCKVLENPTTPNQPTKPPARAATPIGLQRSEEHTSEPVTRSS